ncbi:MAG: nucleotidyltransferase family protein [Candidatus Omnitrophica bacterium]|nr:nucleotidyltransferase family protein [Candidatus Omnitrophota bacterium]
MKALILAAGYGTRLYALVKDTPKALLPIHERPLIDYILDRIKDLDGLDGLVLVTNDKFYLVFQEWAEQHKDFPHKIRVVNDGTKTPEDRLGSIGDIEFALKEAQLDDDVLVIGGDNLFDYNITEYIEFAKAKSPSVSIGLYDVGDLQEATKFGVVGLDDSSKIVSFEEKPEEPQSTLVAMCFYYLPRNSLGLINDYLVESKKSDTAGDYIRWLYQKNDVYGFTFTGKWYDIGSVEAYKEAQEKFC